MLPQLLGQVERGQPVGPGQGKLTHPEPDPRAEDHDRELGEVVHPEPVLHGLLRQPEGLLQPGRVGRRQQLAQDELGPDGVGPAGAGAVTQERRPHQGEGLGGGAEQQRELDPRGEVADLRVPEREAQALLDSERLADQLLRPRPALHALQRQVRGGRGGASQRQRPSRISRPEAVQHFLGERPHPAIVQGTGRQERACLQALQL